MSQQRIRLANIYLEQASICQQQENLEGAIAGFSKAIEVFKEMANDEPTVWTLVADTIEKAAATYKAAGKLSEAADALAEAAKIREMLIKLENPE